MERGKRKEKLKREAPAFSLFPSSPRALSVFPLLLFLLGHPAGASAEERAQPRRLKTNKNSREMHKPVPSV